MAKDGILPGDPARDNSEDQIWMLVLTKTVPLNLFTFDSFTAYKNVSPSLSINFLINF